MNLNQKAEQYRKLNYGYQPYFSPDEFDDAYIQGYKAAQDFYIKAIEKFKGTLAQTVSAPD